ncbi:MAG TPA: ComEC/Rec2 family competence protein [Chloroflexia bacterium]|nr:ComEC/Rec2 family competence protein [Chloroflexia bacterium]
MLPVLVVTATWLCGIFLENWLTLPLLWLWVGVVGGLLLTLIFYFYNRRAIPGSTLPLLLPLGIAIFSLGALRMAWAAPSYGPDGLLYYLDQKDIAVTGVVSGEPTYSEKSGSFRLSTQELKLNGEDKPHPVSGEIYVQTSAKTSVNRGDLIQLTGTLGEPKELTGENFPYRQWLSRQGIYVTLSYPRLRTLASQQDFFLNRWLSSLNSGIRDVIVRNVPGEEGALLSGILLGDKSGLEDSTRQSFTDSGVAHILAVSGSNISIALMLLTLLLNRFFKRRTVLWISLAAILFYVLLVGASPSVVRAGLMGSLAIIGWLLEREYSGLAGLAASALLMTIWQPNVLMDIGFQLSFMATLGLLVLAKAWMEKTKGWWAFLREGLVITVAAELLTLPLVAFYFHQFSLVSILTNLLVLPSLTVIMASGGIAVLAGFIFGGWLPVAGQIISGPAWIFLAYMLAMVKICAGLPFATLRLPDFHPIWVFFYYAILGFIYWWMAGGKDKPKAAHLLAKFSSPLAIGATVLATILVWAAALAL